MAKGCIAACALHKNALPVPRRALQLLSGTFPQTVTSMAINERTTALHSDAGKMTVSIRFVDVPGHQRLRMYGPFSLPLHPVAVPHE